jgi:hypothetical protein
MCHASAFLCKEKYSTIQNSIPIYNYLIDKSKDFIKKCHSADLKFAAEGALEKILKYYDLTGSPLNETYATAIILDPTFKMKFFKENNWTTASCNSVKILVKTLFNNNYHQQATVVTEEDNGDEESFNPLLHHLYKKRKLEDKNEIEKYLSMPVLPYDPKVVCDRVEWWKVIKHYCVSNVELLNKIN